MGKTTLAILAAALAAAFASAQHAGHTVPEPKPVALLPGMGSHHHPIRTSSKEAQQFFDQGMTLLFGFNHEESIRAFGKAAELDPKASMPHWGMALALGASYNDPAPAAERLQQARAEAERAVVLSVNGPENERAYIMALAARYSADPNVDRQKLERDYHAAMKALSERYPDDMDAATLFAESGMNLNPWKLWSPDGKPNEGTLEIVATLEGVLKRDPTHPGANHYYIHAVEASSNPERALPSASRLESLVPGAGHLVHMPAHIYMRTGDYLAAEKSNAVAADVDRQYIRQTGATGMYPMMYYNHNVHFQSWAAVMAGRHAEAKKSAEVLFADVLPAALEDPMLESFLAQPLFVSLRFRKWDEVRRAPDPGPSLRILGAFRLYARGIAAAARGDAPAAEKERAAFQAAVKAIPAGAPWGPNNKAAEAMAVAGYELDARIAEAKGNPKAAIESWEKAVQAEDRLAYDEPPPWHSTRESLGRVLLLDGQATEAEVVFRDDLSKNPRNPRSLFGLAQALKAQGREADAAWVQTQFEVAWRNADVTLTVGDL